MTVYNWRVYCNTEGGYIETWSPEVPTVCPNNNIHEIDPLKSVIIGEVKEVVPVDSVTGKVRSHSSSKLPGLTTNFTGRGDDPSDVDDVGNGQRIYYKHELGDSTEATIYVDFNTIANTTSINEGYESHSNCQNEDCGSVEIVSRATQISMDGTNTDYKLYAGIMVIPAIDSTGEVEILSDLSEHDGGLVYMPDVQQTDGSYLSPVAFWNAEWNSVTKKFENITPAPAGDGRYNIFIYEYVFHRFANDWPLMGNCSGCLLSTEDEDLLGHGMRLKITMKTGLPDHAWEFKLGLSMSRLRTA